MKLIKDLKRKDANGKVYKILPAGTEMKVDAETEAALIRSGHLANPNKETKPKQIKSKKKVEPDSLHDSQDDLITDNNK